MNNTSEEWKETVSCFAMHTLFERNKIKRHTFLYNWENFTDFLLFVPKFSDRSSNLTSLTVVY